MVPFANLMIFQFSCWPRRPGRWFHLDRRQAKSSYEATKCVVVGAPMMAQQVVDGPMVGRRSNQNYMCFKTVGPLILTWLLNLGGPTKAFCREEGTAVLML